MLEGLARLTLGLELPSLSLLPHWDLPLVPQSVLFRWFLHCPAMPLLAGKSLPAANVRSPTAASSSACRSLPPFYVTPERVLDVFRWWKQHNPMYADIETNEDWVVDAIHDDHNLYASLTSV